MPKGYADLEIDTALLAYHVLGTYRLAEQETGVPYKTIHEWVTDRHAQRYKELVEKHAPELERQLIERTQRTAFKAITATDEAIEAADETTNPKDLAAISTAARNFMTVAGIATDKNLTLQGKPTQYTQHLGPSEALKSLARMAGITLDSTAEEIDGTSDTALNAQMRTPNERQLTT